MNKNILLILIVCILSACRHTQTNKEYLFHYDSIVIQTDYPFLHEYKTANLFSKEGKIMLAGYNFRTHSLDFISLTDQTTEYSIELAVEGPNGLNNLNAIQLDHTDIIFFDRISSGIIDFEGNILTKYELLEITDSLSGYNYRSRPLGGSSANFRHYISYKKISY